MSKTDCNTGNGWLDLRPQNPRTGATGRCTRTCASHCSHSKCSGRTDRNRNAGRNGQCDFKAVSDTRADKLYTEDATSCTKVIVYVKLIYLDILIAI